MKIARVFPTRTKMSPSDKDAYFGPPDLFTPEYDEIHISVTFTWDSSQALKLARHWDHKGQIKFGGPAINGEPTNGFKSGLYLRQGVTITSRGCPYQCSWCLIKKELIELDDFPEGNIIQDNNLLACSKSHLNKVFQMLSRQERIDFSGGLDSRLINDEIIERLRGLNIYQLWLAYDKENRQKTVLKAVEKLKKYFGRNQIRCYVLIGYNDDTVSKAEERLLYAWDVGALPFAMLYRNKYGEYPQPEKEWRRFQRTWCRPAAYKTEIKKINEDLNLKTDEQEHFRKGG